ncbi:MAG: anaerobic ribonucleoside-triphosphate reductase activating protein [Candidatus Paceibacterota bacterium]
MLIGGLQKFTALDYPGKIAATIFTVGCNFRCPFCHNGEIVESGAEAGYEMIDEKEVLDFLKTRQGELDGLCITGGEPTLQKDLADFIMKVKNLGFPVKLDTNGANYAVVENLVKSNLIDYFAIDIKTAFHKYHRVAAPKEGAQEILKSLELIINSEIPLELRTTVAPGIVGPEDFDDIILAICEKNPNILPRLCRYSVQAFRPQKCLDKDYEKVYPYEDSVLEEIAVKLRGYCLRVDVIK